MPSITVQAGVQSPRADLTLPSLNVKVTNNGSATLPADTRVRVKTACGTIIEDLTLRAGNGTLTNPGLPYGDNFQVCATTSGRSARATVNNTSYAAPTGATTLNMTTTTSSNRCWF